MTAFSSILSAAVVTLALAGCSAPQAQKDPTTVSVVCDREAPTGSHRIATRCRTAEQREQDAREAQDTLGSAASGSNQEMMRVGK